MPTIDPVEFWSLVDKARDRLQKNDGKKRTLKWLALNSGLSQSTVIRARERKSLPKYSTIQKFAELLEVSESYFKTGVFDSREIDKDLALQVAGLSHFRELAYYLKRMDDTQRYELLQNAKMIYDNPIQI